MTIPSIVVDRASFIAWTKGILLERTGTTLVIGDRDENRKAEEILLKGGTALLTVDGRPFSALRADQEQRRYVETRLEERP